MLVARGVACGSCFEHTDFLELARRHADKLAPETALQQRQRESNELERARRAEEAQARRLAAGVPLAPNAAPVAIPAYPGYQIDMFMIKRGACLKDKRCFRFVPTPPKAGAVLSQLNCTRCGYPAQDHESFGTQKQGEPDLVDEQKRCFRVVMEGGGGAHDSPDLRYDPMPDAVPPTLEPPPEEAPKPKPPQVSEAEREQTRRAAAAAADARGAELLERMRAANDVD